MNRILPYIFVIILLMICICMLKNCALKSNEKYYSEKDQRPPGPWGTIGQGHPWYDYPYTLHNIEYFTN